MFVIGRAEEDWTKGLVGQTSCIEKGNDESTHEKYLSFETLSFVVRKTYNHP